MLRKVVWVWLLMLLLSACSRPTVGLRIAGSTSIQPLAEVLAEEYLREGGPRISIQGGGSTAGLEALRNGVVDLAAISRRLSPVESAKGLRPHIIGYDVLTIAVHPDNPVEGLTREQLRRLFALELTDWADLGGKPGPIHLVSREAGSGSREAFREMVGPISQRALVQSSSGAIRAAVMQDPQAVGYLSLGALRLGGVKPLRIDGLAPGQKEYPLVRPLSLVTAGQPGGAAAAFLRFALSPVGQRLVREEGLVPVDMGSEASPTRQSGGAGVSH